MGPRIQADGMECEDPGENSKHSFLNVLCLTSIILSQAEVKESKLDRKPLC